MLIITSPQAVAATKIDAPAEPLNRALTRIADQAGVQVIFRGAAVKGALSRPVSGVLEPLEALQRAAGPEFDITPIGKDTFAVRRRKVPPPPKPSAVVPEVPEPTQEIVVTARLGQIQRTRVESSYAVTRLHAGVLDNAGSLSAADALRAVPGLWVEPSAGVASNNIRARGIPRDGYASVAVYEDGLPVQHNGGLGYLNPDQSFRLDDGLEAIEVVRGGPAPVFASNAAGGLVNLINRSAPYEPSARVRLQTGTGALARADVWLGGPVGDNWRATVSGFYRTEDGLRPTGFTANQGGQFRLRAERDFANGALMIEYKHLDDRVAFYLPIPVTMRDGKVYAAEGFDVHTGTLTGPDTAAATLIDAKGEVYPFDLTRGTEVKLDQITLKYSHEAAGGQWSHGLRWRQSRTWRNGLFTGFPISAEAYLANYPERARKVYPQAQSVSLSRPVAQVMDATLSSVRTPLDELIADSRFTRRFGAHDLTLGVYGAHTRMGMQRLTATVLIESAVHGQRLDIVAWDATGEALGVLTRSGVTRDGAQFDNYSGEENLLALYAADEWALGPRWRLDLSARFERLWLSGHQEQAALFDGGSALISDDAVLGGTGVFDHLSQTWDGHTVSLAMTRVFGDGGHGYGRVTWTERLPSLTDATSSSAGSLRTEPVILTEIGFKHAGPRHDWHVVAFSTAFSGYRVTDNVYDQSTHNYVQKTAFSDTLTYGVEIEGLWRPARDLDIALSTTLQRPQFRGFVYTELVNGAPVMRDFSHNRLLRVPEVMARLTGGYSFARGRLEVGIEHYGDRYTDAANSVRLPPYTTLRAGLEMRLTPALSLLINGENLTNAIGLTEGNPRAGQFVSGDAGATWLAARPIFGRSFRLSLLWRP